MTTTTVEIRCEHCKRWFASPIAFGDPKSFDLTTMYGNSAQCPHCREMTGCNKENMRMRHGDGGFVGNAT